MKNCAPFFLLCLLLLGCGQGQVSEDPDTRKIHAFDRLDLPERPNILWIVAEDLSPYLPMYGDNTVETPNLSRLAAEGVVFDQFYAAAPVCAPARAAIALGMYPTHVAAGHMRTGGNPEFFPEGIVPYEAMPPAEARMMSEWLRLNGYHCTNNSKEDYQFNKTPTAWDESSAQAHWRDREEGQPFFHIFNQFVTHESRIWAKADDSLWVDENLEVPVPPYLPGTPTGLKDIRRMYSNIKEMDHQVGDILKQLEEDGELENTVIFWYSDHGGPLPRQKRLLYDSGLKVPMIIRFPNRQLAGMRNDDIINFIDLAPTTLSLAGIAPKEYMDGYDFIGEHRPATLRSYIFAAADRFDKVTDRVRAARDKRYKYIRYYMKEKPMFLEVAYRNQMDIMQELYRLRDKDSLNDAQKLWFRPTKPDFEFFDTEADPHEVNDLSSDPQYADKIQELSNALDEWLISIDDTGLKDEEELLLSLWPGKIQPTTADPEISVTDDKVSIESGTKGASIGYKILVSGTEEPASWEVYQDPFTIAEGSTLKAVAHRIGFKRSEVVRKEL